MHPAFETLLVLQDRDLKLASLRKDIEAIPGLKQKELALLKEDQQRVAELKAQLQENRKACDRLELDIQTRKESVKRLEMQRFETRKNEEYTALGHEIENYQEQITSLEDQELALWEQAEALQNQQTQAQETLANHSRSIDAELAKLDERIGHLTQREQELEAERHTLAAELDEGIRNKYEQLHRRMPDPCAEIRRDVCQGCHMKVPHGVALSAGLPDRLESCPNCGRLVYALE